MACNSTQKRASWFLQGSRVACKRSLRLSSRTMYCNILERVFTCVPVTFLPSFPYFLKIRYTYGIDNRDLLSALLGTFTYWLLIISGPKVFAYLKPPISSPPFSVSYFPKWLITQPKALRRTTIYHSNAPAMFTFRNFPKFFSLPPLEIERRLRSSRKMRCKLDAEWSMTFVVNLK